MRLLTWFLRVLIFLVMLWFSLKNTTPVTVYLFTGVAAEAVPLILVMLTCFGIGVGFGLLLGIPAFFRLRKEIGQLKKEAKSAAVNSVLTSSVDFAPTATDAPLNLAHIPPAL